MKAGVVIETIKTIKNTAAKKQMYKLCWNLRTIEEELKSQYKFDDEVDVNHFIILLQNCLVGLPEKQSILLKPIIRQLKLTNLLY